MCVNGELLLTLNAMNARWDYRGGRSMSMMRMVDGSGRSMKMVDGVMLMGVMLVIMVVISCHTILCFFILFYFLDFQIFIAFV